MELHEVLDGPLVHEGASKNSHRSQVSSTNEALGFFATDKAIYYARDGAKLSDFIQRAVNQCQSCQRAASEPDRDMRPEGGV